MSAPCGPSWARASSSRRSASYVNPDLRISDADRTDVADRLSKHYGDGRLDETEFNERLDKAMKAKTQADLSGLFHDLPDVDSPTEIAPRRRPARPFFRVVFLIFVIAIAAAAGHALMWTAAPWLLIGLIAFLWLRRYDRRY
jgi:Flp pilus assembly protein TadB